MQAVLVKKNAPFELYLGDVPQPSPAADEVLVRVHATAVNRADLLQRRGLYPPPPGTSEILGLEAAGEIAAVGSRVNDWHVGDRVFCLLAGGGYAEYVTVHRKMLLPIPPDWTFEQAAAVPEVFYTAFVNLFFEGRLRQGEIALIHAGASGVGTAAIQLARRAGALVIVTAGSEDKITRCQNLGANHGINYKEEDFAERVMKLTNGAGVDLVLDCVGAAYLANNLAALGSKGRLVLIGLLSGAHASIDLASVLRKRIRVIGSVLRSRPLEEKIAITKSFRRYVLPLFVNDQFTPVIDSVYDWTEVNQAHDYVAANRNVGKVVLRVMV